MPKSSQQLFIPPADPYLNTPNTEVISSYPANTKLNPFGNIPITIGQLNISTIGLGNILSVFLHNTLVLEDENRSMGIVTGIFDKTTDANPVMFAPKIELQDLMIPTPVDGHIRLFYEDEYNKHSEHQKAYKVTVILEYIEMHPDIEALPEEQRNKIYEDFAITKQMFGKVDLRIDDATNAVVGATTQFSQNIKDSETTIESIILNKQKNGR
jgi:hypothetical protein